MKYGIIIYRRKGIINIGDDMQLLAIKELYERINISYDELIKIDFYDLTSYDGPEVVLPICFPFYGYNDKGCVSCFSPKIHPIFLSLSLRCTSLSKEDIDYFKRNAPIGCRDDYTCKVLKSFGIDAYLNGCITLSLKKRPHKSNDKVFCVDLKNDLLNIVKSKFGNGVIASSHIMSKIDGSTIQFAEKLLDTYSEKAKLVITSKMHCALPCIAMGIPVIFAPNNFDSRFTWLEDIIHVYTPDEWCDIDWSPQAPDISNYVRLMVAISTNRLLHKNSQTDIKKLELLYSNRKERPFTIEAMEFFRNWIDIHWKNDETIKEFVLWGGIQYSDMVFEYINSNYKNAKLTDFVDSYKTMFFHGVVSKKIEEVNNIKEKYVFVCAATAARAAKEFAIANSLSFDKFCIYSVNGVFDAS